MFIQVKVLGGKQMQNTLCTSSTSCYQRCFQLHRNRNRCLYRKALLKQDSMAEVKLRAWASSAQMAWLKASFYVAFSSSDFMNLILSSFRSCATPQSYLSFAYRTFRITRASCGIRNMATNKALKRAEDFVVFLNASPSRTTS